MSIPGAWYLALGAVLFSIGNFVIGTYLGRTSPGSAFGAAGSLAVLMGWIYYVAYIIIFGAEVTRAYAHRASTGRFRAAAVEAADEAAADEAAAVQPERANPPEVEQVPSTAVQAADSTPPPAQPHAATSVGAAGTVRGLTDADATEAGPEPAALLALTAFSYSQAGTEVKKAAEDTGKATDKAAKDTAHVTKKAAKKTKKGKK
jgi:hypothetical protein